MSTINFKRGDTAQAYTFRLRYVDTGAPIALATGDTVRFRMRPLGGGALKINRVMSIVDGAAGIVSFTPQAADVDTVGDYQVEIAVTKLSGDTVTIPNASYIDATVWPTLA